MGKHVSNEIEIELAILLAFHRLVAFSLAVLADIGGSLGTINSWVTFLFTDTAGALEHAGLSAFGLGVTVLSQLAKYSTKHSATTHPSSPQLKQGPVLRGSVHSALE